MSDEKVVFKDLKIKVIHVPKHRYNLNTPIHHYISLNMDPFCCFFLAEVTSYAEVPKAVEDRIKQCYRILKITYQG